MSPWVKKRRHRKTKIIPILVGIGFCCALLILQLQNEPPRLPLREMPVPRADGFVRQDAGQEPLEATVKRKVYPYSVIPGGVLDRDELMSEVARDPVVAEHYTGFQVQRTRLVRLEQDLLVHVSFRIRDKVYWTKQKVNLKRGETLISDGTQSARTRCGNRVAVLAQEPTLPEEPPAESFEMPIIPEEVPSNLEIADAFPLPAGTPQTFMFPPVTFQTPAYISYPPVRPRFDWPYRPPSSGSVTPYEGGGDGAAVPEPGSLILLGSGLALGILLCRRRSQ